MYTHIIVTGPTSNWGSDISISKCTSIHDV